MKMTVTGILRSGKKQHSVYVIYRHHNNSRLFATGVKIDSQYWTPKGKVDFTRGIKRTKANEELIKDLRKKSDSFNVVINKKKVEIMDVAQRIQLDNREPSVDVVTEELRIGSTSIPTKTVLQLIDEYLNSKPDLAYNTKKRRKHALEKFKTFVSEKNLTIKPESFDTGFYDIYKCYLVESGLNNNSTFAILKALKSFLYYAVDKGLPINSKFREYEIKQEKPQIFYLTQAELKTLINHDFKKVHLANTRDLFVLQCATGLRISDLLRLGPEHIEGNIIKMTAFKNKEPLFIPIIPVASWILEKHKNQLPRVLEQVYNRNLKTIASEAKLNRLIEKVDYKNGKKVFTKVPIHKIISSHMAPKTFITHGVEKGITPKVMAEITGKSVDVLLRHYYGTDEKQIIKEMKRAFGK